MDMVKVANNYINSNGESYVVVAMATCNGGVVMVLICGGNN
jgi:hypothetical protein